MEKRQKLMWSAAVFAALTLFACVTINIYFPAEKVESAADKIVKDIRSGNPEKTDTGQEENQSTLQRGLLKGIMLAFSPGVAWAEEATEVSNATIRALKKQMKERFQKLKPYYQKSVLEEGDDGYLSITDTDGLNLKEKRDLKILVKAENDDRKALYEEVAKALGIDPGQVDKIAEIFAKEWQKPLEE